MLIFCMYLISFNHIHHPSNCSFNDTFDFHGVVSGPDLGVRSHSHAIFSVRGCTCEWSADNPYTGFRIISSLHTHTVYVFLIIKAFRLASSHRSPENGMATRLLHPSAYPVPYHFPPPSVPHFYYSWSLLPFSHRTKAKPTTRERVYVLVFTGGEVIH